MGSCFGTSNRRSYPSGTELEGPDGAGKRLIQLKHLSTGKQSQWEKTNHFYGGPCYGLLTL